MPITIGSNIASLGAQRRLADATGLVSRTSERLASGQRINRASDDAAGLAISESLNSDQRVFSQGIRNFNDGLSLLSIADGAISNLSTIVVRLKELAEQSANGTYSAAQRTALDAEAQSLSKEYTRIIQSTKFNGIQLLDGSLGSGLRLQGGYGLTGSLLSGLGGAIGTGGLQARTTFAAGAGSNAVKSGDFNSDGILDLVVGNGAGTTVSVLLGQANGGFGGQVQYTVGASPNSVTTGDFNGDGILDLVSADASVGRVSVLTGRGDGTFNSSVSFAVGAVPLSVISGDLNRDGNLDIITADNGGTVSILLGRGNATFAAATTAAVGADVHQVIADDLNGDGNLDLITADRNPFTVSVLMGNGDGTVDAAVAYAESREPISVATGDFNGDGIRDLVTAHYDSTRISVRMGVGDGTFSARVLYNLTYNPRFVSTADLNGDGLDDIASTANSTLSIFLAQDNGTFSTPQSYTSGAFSTQITSGDFNRDGVVDLVTVEGGSQVVSLHLGTTQDGTAPLLPFDLKTLAGARQALPVLDQKIQQLANQRGQIGAFQSRIEVGIGNLQTAAENYAAAASRIKDADIASEAADLVRLQILQKAASAVLAQANQQPALAVKLL